MPIIYERILFSLNQSKYIYVTSSFQEKRIMSDHTTSYHQPVKTDVFAGYDIICIYVLLHNFTRFLRKKGE